MRYKVYIERVYVICIYILGVYVMEHVCVLDEYVGVERYCLSAHIRHTYPHTYTHTYTHTCAQRHNAYEH